MTDTTCSPAPLGAQRTTHPVAPQAPTTLYLLALQPPVRGGLGADLVSTVGGTCPAVAAVPIAVHPTQVSDFWEIARFSAPASFEPTLLRWLQKLLGQERGFCLRWQHSTTVRLYQPNPLRELALRIQTLQPFLESCGGSALSFGFRPGRTGMGGQQPGPAGTDHRAGDAPSAPTQGDLAVEAIYLLRQMPGQPLEQVSVLGLRP